MVKSNPAALAALLYTVVVWGITPVMVRSVALALPPYDFLVMRLVISALIFLAIAAALTGLRIQRQDWPRLLGVSFGGTLGFYAFSTFGYSHAPAGIGTLIMSTQPTLIAVFAWLVGSDRLNAFTIAGLAVSFAGSALLVWSAGSGSSTVPPRDIVLGCALIFMASICWASYVTFSRPLIQKYGALKITCLTNSLIALPALPFLTSSMAAQLQALPGNAMVSLLLLFTVGTSSVISWNYAAGHARPTLLGMSLYIMPVVAVVAGWLFLGETVTLRIAIAAGIILAGVALSQAHALRTRMTRAQA